ncbi:MAG: hypothetical protein HY852_00405 [Bradyrhizobium sp.]|uniref:hypothetical protein n=1 Tax=Bradyrhizobium sp. TaxID=376 RepID=UPI0025BC99D7|nr:hypothetical protein [Bradyrhizobium sp.]MBI5260262.1 hypothetical protein [Bradyrhizobium sp.]
MEVFDTAFLRDEQPTDAGVQIDLAPDHQQVVLRIRTTDGTMSVTLDAGDAKKLASRIWTAAKMLEGELNERDLRNAH